MTPFYFNNLLKALYPNSHMLRFWELVGAHLAPSTQCSASQKQTVVHRQTHVLAAEFPSKQHRKEEGEGQGPARPPEVVSGVWDQELGPCSGWAGGPACSPRTQWPAGDTASQVCGYQQEGQQLSRLDADFRLRSNETPDGLLAPQETLL